MKRFAVGYEFLCRIVMMVVVANVAFLVHTLLGLVVVGFFPSIAATYATFRTWLLDVDDRSWSISRTWRTFHQAWLEELGPANKFGWPQFLIWALLIWEYWFVQNNDLGTTGLCGFRCVAAAECAVWIVRFCELGHTRQFRGEAHVGGQDVVEHGDRSPPMQFDDCIVVPHCGVGILHMAWIDDCFLVLRCLCLLR